MEPLTPKRRAAVETVDEPTEVESDPRFASSLPPTIETPPPLPPPDRPDLAIAEGTILGDYRVEAKLGQGGMGDVYLGVHQLIGKRAAIKVLKSDLCADQMSVERFIAEARVVNQIGHPNIVDVFAFDQTPDGRSFLVMELLQGETLRARIARGKIEIAELSEIVKPLVRALVAAHAKGIVHRDLKPDNVFLVSVPGERPQVKLLDFGIAKLVHADRQMQQTASGALVGTPMYISPEQARAGTIDHRADIYTLGGILFEMATGRPPFVATTAFEVVAMHLMEPPLHPSSLATVPPALDELIVGMLAKAPEARPTLAEVTRVLDEIVAPPSEVTATFALERGSDASTALTTQRVATKPARRRGLVVGLAIAAIAVGGIAIAIGMVDRGGASAPVAPPPPPPPTPHVAPIVVPIEAPIDAAVVVAPADAAIEPPPPQHHVAPPHVPPHVPPPRPTAPVDAGASAATKPPPPPPPSDDESLIQRGSVPR